MRTPVHVYMATKLTTPIIKRKTYALLAFFLLGAYHHKVQFAGSSSKSASACAAIKKSM